MYIYIYVCETYICFCVTNWYDKLWSNIVQRSAVAST